MNDALDAALEAAAGLLRAALDVSRVTVRLADEDAAGRLVAEAAAAGQLRMSMRPPVDTTGQMTYQHVTATAEILVQPDCRADPIRPPAELMDTYGVRAQMVAPIKRDGVVSGAVSVHQAGRTRAWTAAEVELVRQAELLVETLLAAGTTAGGSRR
jgi:GAF domain-containing protein